MSEPLFWGSAVALCSAAAVWGQPPHRRVVHCIFKPLAMLLIMTALWRLAPPTASLLRPVMLALLFSFAGDVLLMFAGRRVFAAGLFAFLLGLLTYAHAFAGEAVWSANRIAWFLPLAGVAVRVGRSLWPHLGGLRPAVVLYMSAMTLFAGCALARAGAPGVSALSGAYGVAGALLFMLGDSLLALRRFAAAPVPYSFELGAYFAAQWCLAATVWAG